MNNDPIKREAALEALDEIWRALWDVDIPSPTVPEYVEHHEQIKQLLELVEKKKREIEALPPAQPEPETRKPDRPRRLTVNVCGIPHRVIEYDDNFEASSFQFGMIDFGQCEIRINKNMTEANKKETICHEIIHGILVHLGYNSMSSDEQFVQALGNAIYQAFEIKDFER